jgi:hypothetical protein
MDGFLKPILFAFMSAIIGAVMLTSLADSQTATTQATTATNESLTLTTGIPGYLRNNQLDSITSVVNGTSSLVEGTNYTANYAQGWINKTQSFTANGTYKVTYVYRQVGDAGSRTMLGLIPLTFALGVFLTVLAALSPQFRDMIGLTK